VRVFATALGFSCVLGATVQAAEPEADANAPTDPDTDFARERPPEVIVTGTRRTERSAVDSSVPVDVLSPDDADKALYNTFIGRVYPHRHAV
jgi:hypothetical protein